MKWLRSLALACLLGLLLVGTALAQSAEYRLNVNRNFGYGGGKQIKGLFTLSVVGGPADDAITKVTYLLDGQEMAVKEQSPFDFQFQTESYPYGLHRLGARVETASGKVVEVAPREYEFATAEQESQAVTGILGPIGLIVIILMVIGGGSTLWTLRHKEENQRLPLGASRSYGFKGGAICPRCGRVYPLPWWSFNLLTHVYAQCSFCGKWAAVVPLRSREALDAAEKAELALADSQPVLKNHDGEAEKREQLEDSRYVDEV
ncbi:MAG TPA: hypothetical protein PKW33_07920 [Anaerolineaceae bacterium]|nr:hypothetical protein [Anaerolineaceae bacterium]HPN51500.1 hypothetical protein [Anaerolineaceae bacterium]